MQKAIEQFAAVNKRSLHTVLGAWEVAFSGAEKWSRLNIEASKALLAEAAQQTQALTRVKSAEEFTSFGTGAANVGFERAIGYSRHVQQIAAESQAEAAKWFKSAADEIKDGVAQALEGAATAAPQPSKDAAFAAIQGASAWTDSMVEATKQAVKQTNEFTDAAISATAEMVKNARVKKS